MSSDLSLEQKRALLAEMLQRKPVEPLKYPLSFSQEEIWLLQWLLQEPVAFAIPVVFRITGSLDTGALQKSAKEVVRRQGALRTSFVSWDWEMVQSVDPALEVEMPLVDLSGFPPTEHESRVLRIATDEAVRPFDLAEAPLIRMKLLRLTERDHILITVLHRIIADGWSLGVFYWELGNFYRAFASGTAVDLPAPPIQYGDFALWQRRRIQGEALEAYLQYWEEQLDSAPLAFPLPCEPGAERKSFRAHKTPVTFPENPVRAFQELCRSEGATFYMGLLAAYIALLHVWTGNDDVVLASVASTHRDRRETEGLIGLFASFQFIRTRLRRSMSFRDLLRLVRDTTLSAYAHQDGPLLQVLMRLGKDLPAGGGLPFRVMFALQTNPLPKFDLPGVTLDLIALDLEVSPCDLSLYVFWDWRGSLGGALHYSADLFKPETMVGLAAGYSNLVQNAVTFPDAELREIVR